MEFPQNADTSIALIDINSKVGFLPDIVAEANRAQDYYSFHVEYLPIPAGSFIANPESGDSSTQLYLPQLYNYLRRVTQNWADDRVYCLTRYKITYEESGQRIRDMLSSGFDQDQRMHVLSTFGVREYARQAEIPYGTAVMRLVLGYSTALDRWLNDWSPLELGVFQPYEPVAYLLASSKETRDRADREFQISSGIQIMNFGIQHDDGDERKRQALQTIANIEELPAASDEDVILLQGQDLPETLQVTERLAERGLRLPATGDVPYDQILDELRQALLALSASAHGDAEHSAALARYSQQIGDDALVQFFTNAANDNRLKAETARTLLNQRLGDKGMTR